MMTPAEHYAAAEEALGSVVYGDDHEQRMQLYALAQAHAMLAQTSAGPACPAGTVWPWDALIEAPDGWEHMIFGNVLWRRSQPIGIVALRDHDSPPRMPEEWLARSRRRHESRTREQEVSDGTD